MFRERFDYYFNRSSNGIVAPLVVDEAGIVCTIARIDFLDPSPDTVIAYRKNKSGIYVCIRI